MKGERVSGFKLHFCAVRKLPRPDLGTFCIEQDGNKLWVLGLRKVLS